MKSDQDFIDEMDVKWLLSNGWTVKGNLAYRRILESYNKMGVLQAERIEQILMQCECDDKEIRKIKQTLSELIELRTTLAGL